MKNKCLLFISCFIALSLSVTARVFYVAPTGVNSNVGTIDAPFLTIQRAQTSVTAGDTVYIRGGNYVMTDSLVATYTGIWAYITYLTKSGKPGKRINYWAYPGEIPIFDCSAVAPVGYRVNAFQVNASYIHVRGIEVVGVQVTITTHTQSECFDNQGSYNIYERLKMHDGKAIGFYLTKGGNNLILNCDAYNNWDDVSETKTGGNVDGFGCHPNNDGVGYVNNVFRGCRAWFNSDDGYDCINSFEAVTFDSCWSFYNGYSTTFAGLGDGNGFKAGGYGISTTPSVPTVIPRNNIRFCLAVRNRTNGFYANHHLGGSNWYNNTSYNNAVNFNMLNRNPNYLTDTTGYNHVMKNNLGYNARSSNYLNIDFVACNADTNSFNLPVTVSKADFLSLDQSLLTAPRQADGSLPNIDFMKLAAGSDLIDQGENVGFAYNGVAPDLGCFESNYIPTPVILLGFTTVINKDNVVLNWKAQNQVNNVGWQIERTSNAEHQNWQVVGFVPGSNSVLVTSFSFIDYNVSAGSYYYRLKQIDANKSVTYSKVQNVVMVVNPTLNFLVYPVPINSKSVVSYNLSKASDVQLSVYSTDGNLLLESKISNQFAGNHIIPLEKMIQHKTGAFIIQLITNDGNVQKLVVAQ